jgi:hypothetical protein
MNIRAILCLVILLLVAMTVSAFDDPMPTLPCSGVVVYHEIPIYVVIWSVWDWNWRYIQISSVTWAECVPQTVYPNQ